jgi:hypothetical protein
MCLVVENYVLSMIDPVKVLRRRVALQYPQDRIAKPELKEASTTRRQ